MIFKIHNCFSENYHVQGITKPFTSTEKAFYLLFFQSYALITESFQDFQTVPQSIQRLKFFPELYQKRKYLFFLLGELLEF